MATTTTTRKAVADEDGNSNNNSSTDKLNNGCNTTTVTNNDDDDDDKFHLLKQHILSIRTIDLKHPAIIAAIKAVENEKKKYERDMKLQRKFGNVGTTTATTANTITTTNMLYNSSINNNYLTTTTTTTEEGTSNSTTNIRSQHNNNEIQTKRGIGIVAVSSLLPKRNHTTTKCTTQEDEDEEEPVMVTYHNNNGTSSDTTTTPSSVCNDNNDHHKDEEDDFDDWHNIHRDDENQHHPDDEMMMMIVDSNGGEKRDMNQTMQDTLNDSWQNPVGGGVGTSTSSPFGQLLADSVITQLARHSVVVQNPFEGLIVAFHAILVSPTYQFICTGVPDDTIVKGFALPTRDLPRTQFLPTKWNTSIINSIEQEQNTITNVMKLRYRKNGLGTVLLSVSCTTTLPSSIETSTIKTDLFGHWNDSTIVKIFLGPPSAGGGNTNATNNTTSTTMKEPTIHNTIQFFMKDHFNLHSFQKASETTNTKTNTNSTKSGVGGGGGIGISPTLHYKQLNSLFTQMSQHFDLGTIHDDRANTTTDERNVSGSAPSMYTDNTIHQLPSRQRTTMPKTTSDPLRIPTRCGGVEDNDLRTGTFPNKFIRIQDRYNHNHDNNYIDPNRGRGNGDFDGDLLPRGIGTNAGGGSSNSALDPFGLYRSDQPPDTGGNLMGPDHPMFRPPYHHPNPMNHEQPSVRGFDPAYLGIGGIRPPRFDPYGPPPTRMDYDGTSSSSSMMTGNPGLDLRMMNNRRGLPPHTGFGPNPDHLPPPSSNRNGGGEHNMFL